MELASIGFRARTGRAIAVALAATRSAPRFVLRCEIALTDARWPSTAQPYHAFMHLPWDDAREAVAELQRKIQAVTEHALADTVADLQSLGFKVRSIGVVGSPDRDISRIGSPHIRAHAAEGILFRRVLEDAGKHLRLKPHSLSDRGLEELVSETLDSSIPHVRHTLAVLGRDAGPPWRADERAAAMAAWLALSRRARVA